MWAFRNDLKIKFKKKQRERDRERERERERRCYRSELGSHCLLQNQASSPLSQDCICMYMQFNNDDCV